MKIKTINPQPTYRLPKDCPWYTEMQNRMLKRVATRETRCGFFHTYAPLELCEDGRTVVADMDLAFEDRFDDVITTEQYRKEENAEALARHRRIEEYVDVRMEQWAYQVRREE